MKAKVGYVPAEHPARTAVLNMISSLGIPEVELSDSKVDWILTWQSGALVLLERCRPEYSPVAVDLMPLRRRYKSLPIPKSGPLPRALGKSTRTMIDATAGYGSDSFLMSLMGYEVVALERSEVIAVLLEDGLCRAREVEPSAPPVHLEVTDAIDYLQHAHADCIYLDPMFPPRRKSSALTKRPMRVLRSLVGDDDDRERLFETACAAACRRVVVKRPNFATPWRVPDQTFAGKIMSYDLYLKSR